VPAIRDTSIAYATAATSITVPMCDFAQYDLLLFFVINDQASTYTTPAGGWAVLTGFPSVNTVQSNAYWKIAGATEGDVAITGTTSDSQCGCIISVKDVDQTYPFGNAAVTSVTTHTAASRTAMATITTTVADSLVLYFFSGGGSSTSAPPTGIAIVENKANEVLIVDGTGEGFGMGWLMQRATGITPSDIFGIMPAFATYGVGSKATIQICPPSGGATVIPPYLISDTSQLLDLNAGTVSFDSNTAMAATADTNFGTSITVNGAARTIGDATVAAVADVGINTFHSMGGLTNAASAYMSGAEVLLAAARYNVGTRNVLAHLRNTTPANNQRLSPVASYRGAWMGLKSGTTATQQYKIWQVHGADAPWAAGQTVPVIVNCANTDNIAVSSTGSLTNSDVRRVGFWVGGLGALTTQLCVGPMWAMGVAAIGGGNSTTPVGLADIVNVAAVGKERLSSILQGAGQMLCMQDIQFGDGGTNSVYLNLDSTAIEFPSRRDVSKKIAFYNGIDDSVGLTYYPGASDTIIHKNSVISSANKFKWGIHASASASATYDFSGLSVIGAGNVQLRAVTTFSNMSFTSCPTITQNSAVINSCNFTDSTVTSALFGDMDNITNCAFASSGTGYGIVVGSAAAVPDSPASISLVGNTFTGYAGADGITGNEAIRVLYTSGAVNITISGGGNTPTIHTAGATVNVISGATIAVTNLVTNSRVRVTRDDTGVELFNGAESAGSISFGTTYAGNFTVSVRKASAAPYYQEWVGGGTTTIGLTSTVKALQQLDQ
jgi:hypothetical protein